MHIIFCHIPRVNIVLHYLSTSPATQMIANGNTSDDRVFEVESFDGLHEIVENLKSEILKFQLEGI